MGSNDLFTKLLYMRVAAAILMRKFRVGIIENIEAFLKSECFQMIRDACACRQVEQARSARPGAKPKVTRITTLKTA